MSDSRPPIFDDGGELPEVNRSIPLGGASSAEPQPDGWDDAADDEWGAPNYFVRRAIVVGLVIVAIAGVAFLASRLLASDDSNSSSGAVNVRWNSIVTVDDSAGTVVIADADGEETNRFRLSLNALTDSELIDRTLISTDADAVAVVQLKPNDDITTTDITTVDIATSPALARPSGTARTAIAADLTSERLVLVHGPSVEIIDTADADTVPGARYDLDLAIAEPDGRNVLVTDSGNFQSVLFSFDRDTPSFFPGLALAVNTDIVVTASNVGTNANVTVFDHEGQPGVAAQTASVRAGMIGGDAVILVGVDGEVLALALSNGDVTEAGSLSIGTIESGHVSIGGDRLIVIGTEGTAIIDPEGAIVAELPGARPTVSGRDEGASRSITCLIVERVDAGEVAVIDMETGAVRTEALADPDVLSPADGCSPIVPTATGYISLDEAVTRVTLDGDVIALSPNGTTVAAEVSNRIELSPRSSEATDDTDADDETDPVDVGRSGRTLFFADL